MEGIVMIVVLFLPSKGFHFLSSIAGCSRRRSQTTAAATTNSGQTWADPSRKHATDEYQKENQNKKENSNRRCSAVVTVGIIMIRRLGVDISIRRLMVIGWVAV